MQETAHQAPHSPMSFPRQECHQINNSIHIKERQLKLSRKVDMTDGYGAMVVINNLPDRRSWFIGIGYSLYTWKGVPCHRSMCKITEPL
ncbi:hypothetical protein H6P81_014417 [Aristolochia fimbriata]|uniref:Uncharacterized protein n=1 Tax=Aristolochia fimbriata TaxID=158543 RepID=A0AAV7EHT0_ARIFI|nr:hypothetical protein H6P81_014417 [Aristolochia fimbriata]